jgi:hypothetical protein
MRALELGFLSPNEWAEDIDVHRKSGKLNEM